MKEKYLHIVSLDVPYPPNYGGMIDVYYKIAALHELGVKIILHCFNYNRTTSEELDKICDKVYYYQRNTTISSHFSYLPYTVFSRKNQELINNLQQDNHPILFEGLMSCYYIDSPLLKNRKIIYREANIEHDYYWGLAKASKKIIDKLYFVLEAEKLRCFEKKIKRADLILGISSVDTDYLKRRFKNNQVEFIPAFHACSEITILEGVSDYILYHGNLAVAENENAAIYLTEEVFSKLSYKCVVAGLNPSALLKNKIAKYPNITLKENLSKEDMSELITNAQIHVLVTFQGTGLKLKLLNTLFSGRHLVVNDIMLTGSGLNELCVIANDASTQIEMCKKLMNVPFAEADILERKEKLFPEYSNKTQAEKMIKLIYA